MKTFRKVALTICLLCFVPFAAAFSAQLAAYLAGCDFDVGMVGACTAAGVDIGPVLHAVSAIGYGTFFTVPLLIVTVVAWGLAEIVHRLHRTAHG
jgi:hypothetical protein